MALFSLLGKLGLDSSSFNSGLKDAGSRVSAFASKIGPQLAAAFSAAAIISFTKSLSVAADTILNLSDAYDVTTDKIQLMQEAAARNGVQVEQLLQTTVKIGEARQKALEGDKKTIAAFERMGISMSKLNDKSVDNYELVSDVAKTSSQSNRNFQHQADLVDLIGGKGVRLVGALREIQDLKINLVSDEEIKRVDALGDKLGNLIESIKRSSLQAAGKTIGFFESTSAGDKAYEEAKKQGKSDADARREYSRAFLSTMSGMKLERINGRLVEVPANNEKTDYPTASSLDSAMPAGYTREGRSTGESFDVPVAMRKRERMQLAPTGDLARIGGLYLGADYNLQLMKGVESQVRYLSSISESTKRTADVISQ